MIANKMGEKSDSTKGIPAEYAESAREFILQVVKNNFGGNIAEAARAFGVKPPSLGDLLKSSRGVGIKIAIGVANHLQIPLDEVIGRKMGNCQRLRDLSGWAAAEAEARRQHKELPDFSFWAAGETLVPIARQVTAEYVATTARSWLENATDEQRSEAEKFEVRSQAANPKRTPRD